MSIVDVKQLARRFLELPDTPAGLYTVESYEVLQPAHVAIQRLMTEIRESCSDEVLTEIDRRSSVRRSKRSQKYAGTCTADTTEKTWEAMRVASLTGETQRSLSKRFGVLYNAITRRRWQDNYEGRSPWGTRPARQRSNVIRFPRRRSC
jgi:hypothetical protein